MTKKCCFVIFVMMLAGAVPAMAAGSGADITPSSYQSMLKTGMDVDWLKTSSGRHHYSENAVKDFKAAGLSHVRIRIRDDADVWLLTLMDRIVNDCVRNGLIPIIAYQADYFKKSPDERNMAKAIAWWRTVAEHTKHYPAVVSFDLIIEVTDALNNQPDILNRFYERAVTEIRKTNPTRIIFISPRVRSAPEYLADLAIPSAHNNHLMAEWHFYASGPDKKNPNKLWTRGTPKEKELIRDKIRLAQQWSEKTGIKTWVGAWMPGNYNKGNHFTMQEQIQFARFVSCELNKANIPFAFNADNKFYDRERGVWMKEMKPLLQEIVSPHACE